eukprot:5651927-Pyramimonas_sp.AAC.1
MREDHVAFGRQRFRFAAVMFGDICVRPSVGALIGDPWAVKVFARDISTVFFDSTGPTRLLGASSRFTTTAWMSSWTWRFI